VQPLDRKVETVSALQMLNLENIAHNELGLTDEMMTENAGRGIAEVAIVALNDPAVKVRIAGKADAPPASVPTHTIVILAGNNKSGARAIAAGRHLRNKGITVLVCVVGMDRGVDGGLLEEMRQQVRIFKNLGGRIFNKSELFEHLRKASIPTLTIDAPRSTLGPLANPAPVTLIIDALLGLAVSFEELRTSDQASAYELIEWANRNEAFVLAVDVPTGIDPSTGKIAIIDGGRLYVKPRYIVSVAAPKRGLLEALISSEATDTNEVTAADIAGADESAAEWKLFVVDVGFGPSVWKKAGTKIRKGIEFGDRWVCEMKYRGSSGGDEEQ
jgi:enhancer of mRNA-decapping protein 3